MIQYLHEHALETKIEENGRVLLKSGKAKQLVEFLIDESKKNETEFLLSHDVHSITTADHHTFVVTTSAGIYSAKQVIIAT
ncbi:MAG: NAD(P)/FAD-dependent oxidoreductase [bacterium]